MVYYASDMQGIFLLQDIGRWLTPESLPAWIMALIALGGWFYTWYRGRSRPSKIIVFEANRTLFGKLPEAERRLSIAFNGEEIQSLAMIDLAVRNEGASTIENIHFTIQVNEEARILAVEPQTSPDGVLIAVGESDLDGWEVTIDYLNPLSLHKEQVRLAVFCEPEPEAIQVRGGGKGWSLEFLRQAEAPVRRDKAGWLEALLALGVTGVFIFALFGSLRLAELILGHAFPDVALEWWMIAGLALGIAAVSFLAWIKSFDVLRWLFRRYPD